MAKYGKLQERLEGNVARLDAETKKLKAQLAAISDLAAYEKGKGKAIAALRANLPASYANAGEMAMEKLQETQIGQADSKYKPHSAGANKDKGKSGKKESRNGGKYPSIDDTAAPLYKAGLSNADIGKLYRKSAAIAKNRVLEGGVKKLRTKKQAKNVTPSVRKVANTLKISDAQTKKVLEKLGYEFE